VAAVVATAAVVALEEISAEVRIISEKSRTFAKLFKKATFERL
jgi:hypothetical protein